MENKWWTWTCSLYVSWRTWINSSLKKPSLPLPSEDKKLQYCFEPLGAPPTKKRLNLGSSKPHSHSQLPNLKVKRKRFSQPHWHCGFKIKCFATTRTRTRGLYCTKDHPTLQNNPTQETPFGNLCCFIHCCSQPFWIYTLIYEKVSQTHT